MESIKGLGELFNYYNSKLFILNSNDKLLDNDNDIFKQCNNKDSEKGNFKRNCCLNPH